MCIRKAAVFLLCSVLLVGCAQNPQVLRYDDMGLVADQTAVWPAPPEIPRYRFVGQLTGEENFTDGEGDSESFVSKALRWVVGLVAGKPIPRILQRPQGGLVASDGRVLVTDVSRQAVAVFDVQAGEFQVWEEALSNERFLVPIAIVETVTGEFLVTDAKLGKVVRLNANGEPVGAFGGDNLTHPTGIAQDPESGLIYVADTREHAIKVFSSEGEFVRAFGEKGEGQGQFNSPTHLAFKDEQLYIADTLNARVQIVDRNGGFKASFGRRGLFIGNMPRPKGVTVDNNGLIYVVESYHDYLLIFNAQGQFLMPIGGSGQAAGQFYLPAGVWSDQNNKIYVADMFNGRVVVFEFLGEMGHEG